jgi:hypothetical protein
MVTMFITFDPARLAVGGIAGQIPDFGQIARGL